MNYRQQKLMQTCNFIKYDKLTNVIRMKRDILWVMLTIFYNKPLLENGT